MRFMSRSETDMHVDPQLSNCRTNLLLIRGDT